MQNPIKKVWYKRMWLYIVGGILLALAIYLIVQGIRCSIAIKNGEERLATYDAMTANLSYGDMTYTDSIPDKGTDDDKVILSMHGMFGGYDQGYDTVEDFRNDYRIIAPSRFGYLGSDVMGSGTPSDQAAAYAELLDQLGIDKVYPLATSAGGTAAIRFALDYPERTEGLILYCSSMPLPEKSEQYPQYICPPAFLCNNYAMFLISPLFEPIMGMAPNTIYSMMPINEQRVGAEIDASISNTDMLKNFDAYPIEGLKVPTLILHAKDDKMARYSDTEKAVPRFPNCTFIPFETGGHIGYSVRPSERRKGYAIGMLRQALTYASRLGLPKVMLGCYSDNFASQRTIKKCGGRLTETKPDEAYDPFEKEYDDMGIFITGYSG